MSETREAPYLVLDWNEDFKLDGHVDAEGDQRFAVVGYIQKRKADGVYQAPLIPELFFGADGTQLTTWNQHLTAGDHTILRRDSGNPYVPDSELFWTKISSVQPRQPQVASPTRVAPTATMEFPVMPFALIATPFIIYAIYKLWWHKK